VRTTLPAKAVGWLCTQDPMLHTDIEYALPDLVADHDLA
jgi:hypothetical protein